jgi:ribonucleoside-triphosphate reductase (formate)
VGVLWYVSNLILTQVVGELSARHLDVDTTSQWIKSMSRNLYPGIGQAVADRTFLRKGEDWDKVAERVAFGNTRLCSTADEQLAEFALVRDMIAKGQLLTSGRHLQHGDISQKDRSLDVFSNCSTSITTFGLVYLLLNGSGVGRCYDDDLMLVDWDNAPNVLCVLDHSHPDFDYTIHETLRDAKHKYAGNNNVLWHTVGDSREGWATAIEYLEILAFQKIHRDKLLILDFSGVRGKNEPIAGMQGRPSSGPIPLMNAFIRVHSIKGAGMPLWKQAMYIDHYFAEIVMVGGVRRSARMSVKYWKDPTVLDFIEVKRPVEFLGKTPKQIVEIRNADNRRVFLWSSNNSVGVDAEFWQLVNAKRNTKAYKSEMYRHAMRVFKAVTECAYYDGTGEPGLINLDKLVTNNANLDYIKGDYFSSKRYALLDDTAMYLDRLLKVAKLKQYTMITNPCGEVPLAIWGAMCIIGDVVPYHCDTLEECEVAVRAMTRFLIRVNKLDSVYNKEIRRTNRVNVSLTGVQEFAQKFWDYNFFDLIDEEKSQPFWLFVAQLKRAVKDEAAKYSKKLGMTAPHTDTCIKPSGSVSKLFGLTEGWHLPAMRFYLRWVQFHENDVLVEDYKVKGYPVRSLRSYKNSAIVGFPTALEITHRLSKERMVTVKDVTPEQQYRWVMLGEKYWLRGMENGKPLSTDTGSQISYTLKYDPEQVTYQSFCDVLKLYQPLVRCCSVLPDVKSSGYEYLPEEEISTHDYLELLQSIKDPLLEDIGREHLECGSGGCPTDFKPNKGEV